MVGIAGPDVVDTAFETAVCEILVCRIIAGAGDVSISLSSRVSSNLEDDRFLRMTVEGVALSAGAASFLLSLTFESGAKSLGCSISSSSLSQELNSHSSDEWGMFHADGKRNIVATGNRPLVMRLIFSGMSPDGKLPEIVEVKDHPWFIGVQFHPELK